MAIKIRCHRCRKRISIDDAFAGGFCRCPYCKAITKVPADGEASGRDARRPERPHRPKVPKAPAAIHPPTPEQAMPEQPSEEALPVARPVVVQGVIAMVVSGLLVLLLAGAAVVYFKMSRAGDDEAGRPWPITRPAATGQTSQPGQTSPPTQKADLEIPTQIEENPFKLKGLRVAGMEFTPPVVYVVDCSWGMADLYDPASAVVRHSIRSLRKDQRFNVMIAVEEGVRRLVDGWVGGGQDGDAKAREFFRAYQPAGASDLSKALRRGLAASPRTVVVLAAKAVKDPKDLIEQAKKESIAVLAVSLGGERQATRQLKALAEQTGGHCREFQIDALVELLEELPALP